MTRDTRFDRVYKDPRFQRPKKKDSKVVVDPRFQAVFTDSAFQAERVPIDKYGRKNRETKHKGDLRRLYHIEEAPPAYDPARGEGFIQQQSDLSDSDTASVISEPQEEADDLEPLYPGTQAEQAPLGSATRRLALVNLDWDQIHTDDIYHLVHSFKPPLGSIISVKKFISSFGQERIASEKLQGPPSSIFPQENTAHNDSALELKDDADEFVDHELRKYQLERLKYYYVIIETDSVETARHIYQECDGREFEKTCNVLDLRYVPNETVFEEKDAQGQLLMVEESRSLQVKYQPHVTATRALQHTQVKLTWDNDDPRRSRVTRSFKPKNLEDEDYEAYLASSASEDELDGSKYKTLLESGDAGNVFSGKNMSGSTSNKDVHMEMTFHTALETRKKKITTHNAVSNDEKQQAHLSLMIDNESDTRKHFDMKEIIKAGQKKRGSGPSDDFNMQFDDPRFAAVYDSSVYSIDPTHPSFKKTRNMSTLLEKKRARTANE